jgi:hypothetical protein
MFESQFVRPDARTANREETVPEADSANSMIAGATVRCNEKMDLPCPKASNDLSGLRGGG